MCISKKLFICDICYRFYLECMLPEIVSPLFKLRLQVTDIREPTYIKDAQKQKLMFKKNQNKNVI